MTSFEGSSADAMLGSSIMGGEESVAIDRDGRRMLVGATAKGSDVELFMRPDGGWQRAASLQPGALPRMSFGQSVAFPYLQDRALVGKIYGGTFPSRGLVLIYQVPR